MSRLTELLGRLRNENPALAADLEREVTALTDRRSFGLNFERHVPEAVELPGRKVRRGGKVRILPPRGDTDAKADERRQAYEEIRAMAVEPQRTYLSRPRTRLEDFKVMNEDETISEAETMTLHLMADENGDFPLSSLNEWESQIVRAELDRPSTRGWYRNPPRQASDSLGVSYRDPNGNWRSMHPDFVFFHEVDGSIRASILDPHGFHLEDATVKLRALAEFAEKNGDHFHRIEALAEVSGKMLRLDMQRAAVREAVLLGGLEAADLYVSEFASAHDTVDS